MAKKEIAYGLWCLSFMGFAGLHRFYLRKPISGTLYLLTFGFFGIGSIADLFLIPGIVENQNLKEKLLTSGEVTSGIKPQGLEIEILRVCRDIGGATLSDCVIETQADPKEVKDIIRALCRQELLHPDNRESDGAVIYRAV